MTNELKYKKSLSFRDDPNKTIQVDIALELITNIIKKEDAEKCMCTPKPNQLDNTRTFTEKELVPNLQVRLNNDDKIILHDLIIKLKLCGYPLSGANLRIYSKEANEHLYIGSDPIDENIVLDDYNFNFKLLKIQAVSYIEEKYLNTKNPMNPLSRNNSSMEKKSKRTKERKIGFIIEKVNAWRRLYNGYYDELGTFVKHSLDDAAKRIGISKKSLDDYLLQLRLGRKYGFDFNANRNEKVGKLRAHVKDSRQKK
jgi:hypothetical protein